MQCTEDEKDEKDKSFWKEFMLHHKKSDILPLE